MVMVGGRYEPLSWCNRGGMGEVRCFNDTHLKRKVVIKYLQPGVDANRLLDEQKSLLKVRSKHVVQLYDIVKVPMGSAADGVPAIVLEFIEGKSPDIGSYSIGDEYLKVIWQIASGLADIHSHEVIHRDIKPNNIIIDREGVVKIFDFGLSRPYDRAQTANVIGTPSFMAPELYGCHDIAFDSSVDVYAFGATCLALLSNNPFSEVGWRSPKIPDLEGFCTIFDPDRELGNLIYQCVSLEIEKRPSMSFVRDFLAKRLLKNRHRATVVLNGEAHLLDCKNNKIYLSARPYHLAIGYDGFDFKVLDVSEGVCLNNRFSKIGDIVPSCCVIAFGEGRERKFVTFDVSNPEVMP